MAMNHAGNLAEKKREHPDAVFLEAPRIARVRGANVPQSMWLWPGIQLIGSCRVGHVMNGCFYTVKTVSEKILELEKWSGSDARLGTPLLTPDVWAHHGGKSRAHATRESPHHGHGQQALHEKAYVRSPQQGHGSRPGRSGIAVQQIP